MAFGVSCGHLVDFMVIFSRFGMLYQDKSGTPYVVLWPDPETILGSEVKIIK
jgi:hypothetical protein